MIASGIVPNVIDGNIRCLTTSHHRSKRPVINELKVYMFEKKVNTAFGSPVTPWICQKSMNDDTECPAVSLLPVGSWKGVLFSTTPKNPASSRPSQNMGIDT